MRWTSAAYTPSPDAVSHTSIVLSPLPVTMRLPSALTATELTPTAVPLERLHALARRRVPRAHRLVSAAAHDATAVRAQRHRVDMSAVPLERLHALARRRVPHAHHLVGAAAHDATAVSAVSARRHRADRSLSPDAASHTSIVLSPLPVTMRPPSALSDTE